MVDMVVHRRELRPDHRAALPPVVESAFRGGQAAHQPAGACVNAGSSRRFADRRHSRAVAGAASQADRSVAFTASSACWRRSAIRNGACRRSFTSPAPTAKARRSPSRALSSKPRTGACTLIRRPTWSGSTNAFAWPGAAAASWSRTTSLPTFCPNARHKNGDAPITVFEIETAAAFLLFTRHPADIVLLEVGLGGRLDATNVVERPLASVITRVALDHRDFLGDKHRADRGRKGRHPQARGAGGDRDPDGGGFGGDRAPSRAREGAAPLAGENWTATEERGRLVYQDDDGCSTCRRRGSSAAISSKMPASLSHAARRRTQAAVLRLEHGMRGPMAGAHAAAVARPATVAPSRRQRLWLDGGHNVDGGRAIAAALADLEERVSRPLSWWSACWRPRTARAS